MTVAGRTRRDTRIELTTEPVDAAISRAEVNLRDSMPCGCGALNWEGTSWFGWTTEGTHATGPERKQTVY